MLRADPPQPGDQSVPASARRRRNRDTVNDVEKDSLNGITIISAAANLVKVDTLDGPYTALTKTRRRHNVENYIFFIIKYIYSRFENNKNIYFINIFSVKI